MLNNNKWELTYDLLTNDSVKKVKAQFMYFETCIITVNNLGKHCNIDNIKIKSIK